MPWMSSEESHKDVYNNQPTRFSTLIICDASHITFQEESL